MRILLILKICFIFLMPNAFASEILYLVRSSKALLMGDAYTSLANDDYTLFYNPGALGENEGITIYPINLYGASTNLLKEEDRDRVSDFPKNDVDELVARFLDYPLFSSAGWNPTIKLGNFGFSAIFNGSARLNIRNATHPNAEVITRYDRGLVVGYALDFPSKIGNTYFGLSVKYIWRDGQGGFFDLYEPSIYDEISNPDRDEDSLKETFGYGKGQGLGWDLGLLHVYNVGENHQFRFGVSILDIGDTTFNADAGSPPVPAQNMFVNLGFSYGYRKGAFNWLLSADLHPLNGQVVFGRMAHVGGEIGFDIFQLLAGFNGGYFSLGAEIDLKFVKIIGGVYDIEVGGGYRNQKGRRMLLYLGLVELHFK